MKVIYNSERLVLFINQSTDDQERLKFVQRLASKVNSPSSQDAYVYATVEVSNIQRDTAQIEEARKNLDECEKILDKFDAVETIVHAAFYKANAEYYKVSSTRDPSQALFSFCIDEDGIRCVLQERPTLPCLYFSR
jgi:26S proteasome regulatory subunit N9